MAMSRQKRDRIDQLNKKLRNLRKRLKNAKKSNDVAQQDLIAAQIARTEEELISILAGTNRKPNKTPQGGNHPL